MRRKQARPHPRLKPPGTLFTAWLHPARTLFTAWPYPCSTWCHGQPPLPSPSCSWRIQRSSGARGSPPWLADASGGCRVRWGRRKRSYPSETLQASVGTVAPRAHAAGTAWLAFVPRARQRGWSTHEAPARRAGSRARRRPWCPRRRSRWTGRARPFASRRQAWRCRAAQPRRRRSAST